MRHCKHETGHLSMQQMLEGIIHEGEYIVEEFGLVGNSDCCVDYAVAQADEAWSIQALFGWTGVRSGGLGG